MAKQIIFTDKETDRDYILEFNRNTVRQMEANGFNIMGADSKPLTFLTDLFAGAFKMHHRFVKPDVIGKLQERFADKDKLTQRLIEMYSETLESLTNNEGDEDKENLIEWSTND